MLPAAVKSKTSTFGTSPWLHHVTSCCEPPCHMVPVSTLSTRGAGLKRLACCISRRDRPGSGSS
eukprot:scaffold65824_cov69-Phaeocystis_antarctica.AAC.5